MISKLAIFQYRHLLTVTKAQYPSPCSRILPDLWSLPYDVEIVCLKCLSYYLFSMLFPDIILTMIFIVLFVTGLEQ